MQLRYSLATGAIFVLVHLCLCVSSSLHGKGQTFEHALHDVMMSIVRDRRAVIDASTKTSFTQKEIKRIVDAHNAYRSTVSPAATDMIEVVWDIDIANFAQAHVDKCTGAHNPDRDLPPWTGMGENLYFMPGDKIYDDLQPMGLWWKEKADYSITPNSCGPQKDCTHYIAMAWASHEKIGCGIKKCDTLSDNTYLTPPTVLYLCNYSGRVLSNTRPYTTGTSCTACPAAFPKCRHNLCISEAMETSGDGFDGDVTIVGLTPGGGNGGDGDKDNSSAHVTASVTAVVISIIFSMLLKR